MPTSASAQAGLNLLSAVAQASRQVHLSAKQAGLSAVPAQAGE